MDKKEILARSRAENAAVTNGNKALYKKAESLVFAVYGCPTF